MLPSLHNLNAAHIGAGVDSLYDIVLDGSVTTLDLSGRLNDDDVKAAIDKIVEALQSNFLESLNLKHNQIGPGGAQALAGALQTNTSLTSLNLADNKLCGVDGFGKGTYTAEGIKAVADALSVSGSLTSLDVGFNRIGKEAALGLVSIFKEKDQMQSVGLASCSLGVDGAKAVADYVSVSGSLTSLNLSSNTLTGGKYVKEAQLPGSGYESGMKVQYEGKELTILKEKDSDDDDDDDDVLLGTLDGIFALAYAIRVSGSLTSLDLQRNRLGPEGAKALAAGVAASASLTSLNVCANEIGAEGTKAMANALRVTGSLTSLDISVNEIGNEDAKAIADALRVNGSLTSLDVGYNEIGDEGASAIGTALKNNKECKLKELKMANNKIGADGAKAIAAFCADSASLTKLDVRYNLGIGDGKAVLQEAVKGRDGFSLLV